MKKSNMPSDGLARPASGSREADNSEHLKKIGWGSASDKYRMDSNKLLWHKDRVLAWVGRDNSFNNRIVPLHIDMGISTGCNLACHFCYGVIQARKGFLGEQGKMIFMSEDLIKSVFRDAKDIGVKSIALVGEGENTLNPALYPAIRYARDIELDISLATHGANVNRDYVENLLTGLQWLRVNISAATEDSYMRVHQRPWLSRVVENTRFLVNERAKFNYVNHNGMPTTIGFQMVLTGRNLDQVIPLVKLGKELGIDYTVIKACSDTPEGDMDVPEEEYLQEVETFKKAEEYSSDSYNVIVRWNKLGNLGNKDYSRCHGTRFIVAMSGDGTIFPCGHWFDIERERFQMGNVNDLSLKEIVMSDRYWKVQKEIYKVDLRQCETNCRHHQVNQTLNKITNQSDPFSFWENEKAPDEVPKHINFV